VVQMVTNELYELGEVILDNQKEVSPGKTRKSIEKPRMQPGRAFLSERPSHKEPIERKFQIVPVTTTPNGHGALTLRMPR
jgi:hypothetical protein